MSSTIRGIVPHVPDADLRFTIDGTTRVITNESKKSHLLQYDHNSERFGFKMDRYIDGHDMLECDTVIVHYRNKSSIGKDVFEGSYPIRYSGTNSINDDYKLDPDTENLDPDKQKIIFSWLIDGTATQYAGSLSFLIFFGVTGDEGNFIYRWNTMINNTTTIATGMDNSEETADVIYPNFIEDLEERITDEADAFFNKVVENGGGMDATLEDDGTLHFTGWMGAGEEPIIQMSSINVNDEGHLVVEDVRGTEHDLGLVKGDSFTYEDFTAEQLESLVASLTSVPKLNADGVLYHETILLPSGDEEKF